MNRIRKFARSLIVVITIIVLLTPLIVLNVVTSTILRFIVVFVSAALFVSAITVFSKLSMAEIFAAGATYSAVLVVFVSGSSISGSGGG